MSGTVTVRMYNVGFGDAFLVTVSNTGRTWRMLVDCGVHNQGQARPIRESVSSIIADLRTAAGGGVPRLDVVVATHRHADHISGFAVDQWQEVEVGEVWLPFVANDDDPDTRALRHSDTALRLLSLIERRTVGLTEQKWPVAVTSAYEFALNSLGNDRAMDRLLSRNGVQFANTPPVRFLPDKQHPDTPIELDGLQASVHVLGPGRDPAQLKRMSPPSHAGWLDLTLDASLTDKAEDGNDREIRPLFDPVFEAAGPVPAALEENCHSLRLDQVNNDIGLLTAASILERAVNNTSLFMVLDVAGTRLVFPGDAQYGPWEDVLNTAPKRALVSDAAFYKVGHHGSHNATPKEYVEQVWLDGGHAMVPYGLVERWKDSIPKRELMDALHAHNHTVTRADAPEPAPRGDCGRQLVERGHPSHPLNAPGNH